MCPTVVYTLPMRTAMSDFDFTRPGKHIRGVRRHLARGRRRQPGETRSDLHVHTMRGPNTATCSICMGKHDLMFIHMCIVCACVYSREGWGDADRVS